jgi:hypothetical protein
VTSRGISRSFDQAFCLPNDRSGRAKKRNRSDYVAAACPHTRRQRAETSIAAGFALRNASKDKTAHASAGRSSHIGDAASAAAGNVCLERPAAHATARSIGDRSKTPGTIRGADRQTSRSGERFTADNETISGGK